MFDFQKFTISVLNYENQKDLSKYIESCYMELEEYLEDLSATQVNQMKFDIEDLLLDMLDAKLILEENSKMINAFLLLIAQKLEQVNLIGAITLILNYLPTSAIKNRLEASRLYLKINDISKDYNENFEAIVELISSQEFEEEYRYKKVNALINFYATAMKSFARVNNSNLAYNFKKLFLNNKDKYPILNDPLIANVINILTVENYDSHIENILEDISKNRPLSVTCSVDIDKITKEQSPYSKKLYALNDPNFSQVRKICFNYIRNTGDSDELYERLERGVKIIDDEPLLYQYLCSFGEKHKEKLYSAFDKIIDSIKGTKINIVDWGCGQAFATMMLLNYAKHRDIKLDISDIHLIEPSRLALSRGLLHVDVFKTADFKVKAINSDLDCLDSDDIVFDNDHKTLHLFSNILDVESFRLDTGFLQKISSNIKSNNLFVCVSPNINAKRNNRIDLFYKYFDDNFDTDLISARDTDINHHQRYEKIFEVRYTKPQEVVQVREEAKKESRVGIDIYSELKYYEKHISPILDLEMIDEIIEKDPEYLIFKTRKTAEVITSKIYSNYETNSKNVSFNDMIRYLSFEKKIFTKKITSNLHTIRTIGNIHVHEQDHEQKLDAHLMLISLLILLKELERGKLF